MNIISDQDILEINKILESVDAVKLTDSEIKIISRIFNSVDYEKMALKVCELRQDKIVNQYQPLALLKSNVVEEKKINVAFMCGGL